jgi:phosphatidylglycerophosphate synthase
MEKSTIKEAVILAPAGDPGWPLAEVAGLPLVERTLMGVRSVGIEAVHLCCDPEILVDLRSHLAKRAHDRRLPETHLLDLSRLSDLSFSGLVVVLDGRWIAHVGLLKDAVSRERAVSYVQPDGQPARIEVVSKRLSPDAARFESFEPVPVPEGTFSQPAETAEGRQKAKRLIFKSLAKPSDGWISAHLNRPVSISISKVLIRFPVTPNMITLFCFVLGIASGVFAALGTYLGFAIGGVLRQIYSIIDGSDGEIARVKFLHSRFGQWMDTTSDYFTNALYLAGVTIGSYRVLGSNLLLWVGVAAVGLYVSSIAIVSWQTATRFHSGTLKAFEWDLKKPENRQKPLNRLLLMLEPFLKLDSYSFFYMVVALAGVAWLALPFAAVGSGVFLIMVVIQTTRNILGDRRRKKESRTAVLG